MGPPNLERVAQLEHWRFIDSLFEDSSAFSRTISSEMTNQDDFISRIFSSVELKIARIYDSQRLREDLRSILREDYNKMFDHAAKKTGARIISIFEKGDTLLIDKSTTTRSKLLIVANAGGDDALSSFVSFAFANSLSKHIQTVAIVPRTSSKIWQPGSVKDAEILKAFTMKEHVDRLVVLRDGLFHFDGFYITVPIAMKGDQVASEVIAFLRKSGHTVGMYSAIEDYPHQSITTTDNPIMSDLVRRGVRVYGFTIPDDISAGTHALQYLCGVHLDTSVP